ncbi:MULTISPECIES: DUF4189 domain-containing protein [Stenotrophomonas]|jgi:hypothetical protein
MSKMVIFSKSGRGSSASAMRLLMLLWVLFPLIAFAEGNCPPGFYPIGGQGVQGCAPIPGGGASAGQAAPAAAPVPTGEWIKTWGAIAVSQATSDAGVSTGKLSRSEAERQALELCAGKGANDCALHTAYRNQCVSWMIPGGRLGKGKSGIGTGPTPADARSGASKVCRDDQGAGCIETYANCTEPQFKKY